MTRTPRRLLPLLAAVAAAACGSASHSSGTSASTSTSAETAGALPATPTRAVQQALAALSDRPFDEALSETARLHVAGVPQGQAARLNAGVKGAESTQTDIVQFTSARQFEATVKTSPSSIEHLRASGGVILTSTDGVNYRAAPPRQARALIADLQEGLAFVSRSVRHVADRGRRVVSGTATEEYTASYPGRPSRPARRAGSARAAPAWLLAG